MTDFYQTMKDKMTSQDNQGLPIQKAGHPDPLDIEDNKMVSEGAQYGIEYYNRTEQ